MTEQQEKAIRKEQRMQITEAIKWNDKNNCTQKSNAYGIAEMTGLEPEYVRWQLELMRQMEQIYFSGQVAVLN